MNFIELREKETNVKVLIPLNSILSILQLPEDETAFIETHIDIEGNGIGFYVKETYAEIIEQLVAKNDVLNFKR